MWVIWLLFPLFLNALPYDKKRALVSHVTKQFYERLEIYDLDETKTALKDAVWLKDILDGATPIIYQVVGITSDCNVYKALLNNVIQYYDFAYKESERKKCKACICKNLLPALVESDPAGINMTLLVLVDTVGRRLRVQSVNSFWNKVYDDVEIYLSKLRFNRLDWFYTQDLEKGFTFDRVFVSGRGLFAFTRNKTAGRFYRVKIYIDKEYMLRPYLEKADDLNVDVRINGPTSFKIAAVDNMFNDAQKKFYCPYEVLTAMLKNDIAFLDTLPKYLLDLCRQQIKKAKNRNKKTFELENPHYLRLSYPNLTVNSGFILQTQTDGIKGPVLTMPISSLQSKSFVGFSVDEAPRNYSWIDETGRIRLKDRTNKNEDQISIYRVIPQNQKDYNCTEFKEIDDTFFLEQFKCYEEVTRDLADPRNYVLSNNGSNLTFVGNYSGDYSNAICKEIVENEGIKNMMLMDWAYLVLLSNKTKTNSSKTRWNCKFSQNLIINATRIFLNHDHFHARMAYPYLNYKLKRRNPRGSDGYTSKLLLIFLGICAILTALLVSYHYINKLWVIGKRAFLSRKKRAEKLAGAG